MTDRSDALRSARNILALGMDDDETLAIARALIESEEERERLSDAIYIQRAYAVTTGALITPSAIHAMMQRMVDDIDAALRREEVRDG